MLATTEASGVTHGSFDTVDAAIACARAVIEEWIAGNYQPGMTADELESRYLAYGHVPVVRGAEGVFDAYQYFADRICRVITYEGSRTL